MSRLLAVLFPLLTAAALAAADPAKPAAKGKPNRLAGEVSPYLLQHAHNPVDWYPWGPEAFAKAKADNKLVFLSIGYSACHWCHVMERESFSDAGIAATLNKHFVCIKVDREERPDVDEVYMAALQVMNQGGGWPLSMFLTADAKPIFGGTYWPPADVGEGDDKRSGFPTVLNRVIELATKEREALTKQADKVAELTRESLDKSATDKRPDRLDAAWLAAAADAFEFDPVEGGFGQKMRLYRGTKFPRVPALSFLLRHAAKPDAELDKSLRLTLDRLAAGGIRDHLGGGFHRYSTERTWTVPHFEKMLYDNAQLMELYADSFARTKQPQDADAARDIARFVARDLTAPGGGFYSALDADASGEEGASYVWTKAELDRVLGDSPAAKQLRADLSLDGPPNFEKDRYIPRRKTLPDFAKPEPPEVAALRAKLLGERDRRPQPFRDTKVLAGWNGQMVAGYARAGQVLNEPKFTAAAETAAHFVLKTLRDPAGRLLRVYAGRPGEAPAARGTAFLDDYAYLVHGLLNLHDATQKPAWLAEARTLTDQMAERFGDPKSGAFTLTPNDGERLFARGQDRYDGAQPSANGVAVRNLVRLAALTGDAKYKQAAEKALLAAGAQLRDAPTAVPTSAEALELWFAAASKGR